MVGLVDIAPSTRTVRAGGADVTVTGISVLGIAALLRQFPELRGMFTGDGFRADPNTLMEMAPKAVSAIIAAGTGAPGDTKAIAIADGLPVGVQFEFLKAIGELTMPDGPGPLLEALNALTAHFDAVNGKAPASN